MRNCKQVGKYLFGKGSIQKLEEIIHQKFGQDFRGLYCIDYFFRDNEDFLSRLPIRKGFDYIEFIDTSEEPKTDKIDMIRDKYLDFGKDRDLVISIGGGSTLDTGKALANLFKNKGRAETYQGWDLVKHEAVYKIAVPTLSGTGAEASRTCVMTNASTGLKLGMNSDYTIYDQLILDPDLTKSAPKEQYFYSGMDSYIHSVESLQGRYRNAVGDSFSKHCLELVREVFSSEDMMSSDNREKLMLASYMGGCAIANSYVGLVHPFSAGLSVVLGVRHCIANCISLAALGEYYPNEREEMIAFSKKNEVEIPKGLAKGLNEELYQELYEATVVHKIPLSNALGDDFKEELTYDKVRSIFESM